VIHVDFTISTSQLVYAFVIFLVVHFFISFIGGITKAAIEDWKMKQLEARAISDAKAEAEARKTTDRSAAS